MHPDNVSRPSLSPPRALFFGAGMSTLEFLNLILPPVGIRYVALFRSGYAHPQHRAFLDNDSMAAFVEETTLTEPDTAVYHACAAYQRAVIEVEKPDGSIKRRFRSGENWLSAKAFWVDLDCGQAKFDKGDGYLTKSDAAKAILKFCKTIDWPVPLLVDSGNGLHAYWPLVKPVSPSNWVKVATALKSVLAHCGVIADPTRTADFASILRPVGSMNNKNDQHKPVLAKNSAEPASISELAGRLKAYIDAHDVKMIKEPKRAVQSDLNSDLTAHLHSYPDIPVNADLMASKCSQVAQVKETQGDAGYEHWRGVIGLLTHCEDGRNTAQLWSERREETGHSQLDWDIRFDSWTSGPTTCEFFQGTNLSGCKDCPVKGKIKTPLVLGRYAPENEETTTEIVDETGTTVEVEVPAVADGYAWSNGMLCRLMVNKDGVQEAYAFSHQLFYPTSRIRTEEGTYRIGLRIHMPNKKVRDIEMAAEAMASQTDMLRALARYELFQSNHKDAGVHMAAYLRDQLNSLKTKVEEVNTLTSFGWKNDNHGFLLGDRLYSKDNTVRRVLVGGNAAKFKDSMGAPKGTVEGYAAALNFMYNRKGMEHWQYAVCSGWGSVLTPFCEELYKGLLFAISGGDSGKGKTTVCYASLYAFGDAERMTLKSKEGFTYNALWAFLGAYNNVPVLLDEFTNMEPSAFSDVAYGVSRGEEKVRLTSKGGTVSFANTATWRVSPFVTGNKDFHGLLAASQANSQAEAVRLIQINIDRYPVIRLHKDATIEAELVQQAVEGMKANAGSAGDVFIKYISTHQRAVADKVRETMNSLVEHIPGTKYRYYRNHAACTLTMAKIAKDLGVIDFDLEALEQFAIKLLVELAETVMETNTVTTEDAFSRMMSALAGRILVTAEFRDKRSHLGPETPRNRIIGEIAGRYVLGSKGRTENAGWIMLAQKEVREWCMNNRIDYNAMVDHLSTERALIKRSDKITLTRGTDMPTVQARCIVVDAYKLDKDAITLVGADAEDGEKVAGAV